MKLIPTTKGIEAIVDDEDYEWLSKYSWHNNNGYAYTTIKSEEGKPKSAPMHRMVIDVPKDKYVDHINGIRFDNRKMNLRVVTTKQNIWNSKKVSKITSSKYKGVWQKEDGVFHVGIKTDDVKSFIGSFNNEIAAANAYNYYATELRGEYAKLNDVPYMEREEWIKFKYQAPNTFKGVTWDKLMNMWKVTITLNSKSKNMGYFNNEIVAANYYNHLVDKVVNICEYIPYELCKELKYKQVKSSPYNGVAWKTSSNKWTSSLEHNKQYYFLGYFDSEIEAALAYNEKAIELNIRNLNKKLNIIEDSVKYND